jgi:predicted adenine nucleotide alpha hydrolase (AANH) superfamily ATPase
VSLLQDTDSALFFFNPNIAPAREYNKRLSEQKRFAEISGVRLIEKDGEHDLFLQAVKGLENEPEGGKRCEICFRMRLEETAKTALQRGFDTFTTTLTVSPHKNAKLINKIAEEVGNVHGITAMYSDFKKKDGYLKSIRLSEKYGLYRQNYCGCEFCGSLHS